MLSCLGANTPEEARHAQPERVSECVAAVFGGKVNDDGYTCHDAPTRVIHSDVLDSCNFALESAAPRESTTGSYQGLARFHVLFVDGQLVGFTLLSTRPQQRSSAPCGDQPVFQAWEERFAQRGTKQGPGLYQLEQVQVHVAHEEITGGVYPTVRDSMTVLLRDRAARLAAQQPMYKPEWTRQQLPDVPQVLDMPHQLKELLRKQASLLNCSDTNLSLEELLGQPLDAASLLEAVAYSHFKCKKKERNGSA